MKDLKQLKEKNTILKGKVSSAYKVASDNLKEKNYQKLLNYNEALEKYVEGLERESYFAGKLIDTYEKYTKLQKEQLNTTPTEFDFLTDRFYNIALDNDIFDDTFKEALYKLLLDGSNIGIYGNILKGHTSDKEIADFINILSIFYDKILEAMEEEDGEVDKEVKATYPEDLLSLFNNSIREKCKNASYILLDGKPITDLNNIELSQYSDIVIKDTVKGEIAINLSFIRDIIQFFYINSFTEHTVRVLKNFIWDFHEASINMFSEKLEDGSYRLLSLEELPEGVDMFLIGNYKNYLIPGYIEYGFLNFLLNYKVPYHDKWHSIEFLADCID